MNDLICYSRALERRCLPPPPLPHRTALRCVAIKNMASGAFLRFNCRPPGGHSLPPFPLSLHRCFGFLALLFTHGTEVCAGGFIPADFSAHSFAAGLKKYPVSSFCQFWGKCSKLAFRSRSPVNTTNFEPRWKLSNCACGGYGETRCVSAAADDEKVVKNSERWFIFTLRSVPELCTLAKIVPAAGALSLRVHDLSYSLS